MGEIVEKIREVGSADVISRDDLGLPTRILCGFEAEDGWDLAEIVHELETELEGFFGDGIKFPKPLPYEKEAPTEGT
jgi:hypothetical protein